MYLYTVATLVGIYCILTLGLNTITGIAGQISLGHAAFLGIGAYTAAILTVSYGWDFWPALIAAVVAAGGAGALVGAAAIRVREDFLAITTMGVNFVVVAVFLYFPFFGGAFGIGGIPAPRWFGAVLGKPGRGARVFASSMEWERLLIMAAQLGALDRALEEEVAAARQANRSAQLGPAWRWTRNSLLPSGPRIGEAMTSRVPRPRRHASAATASSTARCATGSRTTPRSV